MKRSSLNRKRRLAHPGYDIVGAEFITDPTEARAKLEALAAQYASFDSAVQGSDVDAEWKGAWDGQVGRFKAFVAEGESTLTKAELLQRSAIVTGPAAIVKAQAMTGEVDQKRAQFQSELVDWEEDFEAQSGGGAIVGPKAKRPIAKTGGVNWNHVIIGGGVILGAFAVGYLITSVSEASGEARWWDKRFR